MSDPAAMTRLSDWPDESEFAPLIEKARAAGDYFLVKQLEADRAFCTAAREQIRRPADRAADSSA